MLFSRSAFHALFFPFVAILMAIALTACEPIFQTRDSQLPPIPVVYAGQSAKQPSNDIPKPGTEESVTSTALTQDEMQAEPTIASASSQNTAMQPADEAAQSGENDIVIALRTVDPKALPEPIPMPLFNPADLVGKPQSFVSRHFGQADFVRTEGVLHVIQYRQPHCVIDLFISVADAAQAQPLSDAHIIDWAMRERIVNAPLDLSLCQQQFAERKLQG